MARLRRSMRLRRIVRLVEIPRIIIPRKAAAEAVIAPLRHLAVVHPAVAEAAVRLTAAADRTAEANTGSRNSRP